MRVSPFFSSSPFILSGQVANFLGFLPWDPSLIWNTEQAPFAQIVDRIMDKLLSSRWNMYENLNIDTWILFRMKVKLYESLACAEISPKASNRIHWLWWIVTHPVNKLSSFWTTWARPLQKWWLWSSAVWSSFFKNWPQPWITQHVRCYPDSPEMFGCFKRFKGQKVIACLYLRHS